jgi:2-polyprenyl-3-methyl-5-hydroxy-6-metoxy-1,4-benzoquinol methylase
MRRFFGLQAMYGHPGFPPHTSEGRALDIGCGDGAFLSFLKHHDWDVRGVEISEAAAARASEVHGVEIHVGPIATADFPEQSFDFVHMSHVIEHLHHPERELSRVGRLLREGGMLYVETPNAESLNARRLGRYWFPWETPRHLHVFSTENLEMVLEATGFEVIRMETHTFRHVYRYADKYRAEELTGRHPGKARIRALAVPKAAWLAGTGRLDAIVHPRNGDIMSCWARRVG